MGTPYLAELKVISWNYAPRGWAFCNGQLLPINQNQALFSLLGTTYGGDGRVNFALPDLRGRTPIYAGQGISLGQRGGEEFHTVTLNEMPQHTHALNASTQQGDQVNPNFGGVGRVLARDPSNPYANGFAPAAVAFNPGSVTSIGGSQPHENRQPFLVLNVIIALTGVFPSRN